MAGSEQDDRETGWHLDKRVPIALIGVLIVQIFWTGWQASAFQARLDEHSKQLAMVETTLRDRRAADLLITDRLARVEARIDGIGTMLTDLRQIMMGPRPHP